MAPTGFAWLDMGQGNATVADIAQTDMYVEPRIPSRAPSGAGVRTPVVTAGTGPGAGWIDFPFGVTPEVFLLEQCGAVAVFTQRIR